MAPAVPFPRAARLAFLLALADVGLALPFSAAADKAYAEWLSSHGAKYVRSATLAGADDEAKVALHWTVDGDRIHLAVAAEATGWVGFGLAEAGGMPGSDMAVFSLTGDQGTLIDAHAVDYALPVADECSDDWVLQGHVSNGGVLVWEASRLLDTGDAQDREIVDDSDPFFPSTNVIAAWGDGAVSYHGPDNRVKGAVRFFGDQVESVEKGFLKTMEQESEGSIVVAADKHIVPAEKTHYHHLCWDYSSLVALGPHADSSQFHVLAFEPVLDQANLIHHMRLSASESTDACNQQNEDNFEMSTAPFIFTWAKGNPPYTMPLEAGYLFNKDGKDGFGSLLLEIHYDNPKKIGGAVDSSGLRLYYTRKLRQYNAGILELADPLVLLNGKATGDGYSRHTFICPSSCTQEKLSEDITVFGEGLHMHSSGLRMTNALIRDGRPVHESSVDYYDFEQAGAYLARINPFNIQKGDDLVTTCYYKTGPDGRFGFGSDNEMCIGYLFYYPKQNVPLGKCAHNLDRLQRSYSTCTSKYIKESVDTLGDVGRTFGEPTICASNSSQAVGISNMDYSRYWQATGKGPSYPNPSKAKSIGKTAISVAVVQIFVCSLIFLLCRRPASSAVSSKANEVTGPQDENKKKKHTQWKTLDGLRGVGIILVIMYHMGYRLMRQGWLCISIFFAFSGFLITGITVQAYEKTGRIDIGLFWSRRIARLFPALFSTIMLCSLSVFFRDEDEAELWYERQDLLWACTFLTNYNLIFVKKDDYFAHFLKPSITRHMWTLSIEEQYYLVWPIIFYLWTRFFPVVPRKATSVERDEEMRGLVQGGNDTEEAFMDNEAMEDKRSESIRRFLKALCVGECAVVIVSYFSSWLTISNQGMSAAYYSTWSRMGDLACGGLVFCMVRLQPQIYKRVNQEAGLKPMTTGHRIVLEIFWFLALCLTVLPPMIQAPLEDMLPLYFYYFRLPFSFLVCFFAVAGIIQDSEPLPSWAIFSRSMSSRFLTTLGIISYGIYLNHWPIILFFGTPVDHADFENDQDDEGESWYLLRDAMILFSSLLFGLVSFMHYEKPLLFRARKMQPWKVIACGLLGSCVTACVVLVCFSGVNDPTATAADFSDENEVFGDQYAFSNVSMNDIIPGVPSAIFNNSSFAGDTTLPMAVIDPASIQDERFTPVWLFNGWGHLSDATLFDILDEYTIPKKQIPCHGNSRTNKHGRDNADNAFKCGPQAGSKIYEQLIDVHPENSIIIMCISYSRRSPCDVGEWKEGTKWIWLSSPVLCGEEPWLRQKKAAIHHAQKKRCPDKLQVEALSRPGVEKKKKLNTNTFTGRLDVDLLYLMRLLLAVEEKVPGALNQHSLFSVQNLVQVEETKEWARQKAISKDEMKWSDRMKTLVMGESVADRIGGILKELLESNLPCIDNELSTLDFPRVDIVNLAMRGTPSILFFLSCEEIKKSNETDLLAKTCSESAERQTKRQKVLQSVPSVRPEVIILHDGRWGSYKSLGIKAMSNFLQQAISHGTKHVFYLTGSCTSEKIGSIRKELAALEDFLRAKRCGGEKSGIAFTIVAWHLLTCPTFDQDHCSTDAHGFHNILADGTHPSGPSGEWLCAQVLASVMSQVAMGLPEKFGYAGWDSAIKNPVSACLLKTDKPDDDPPLTDLVQMHWVCP